MTWWQIVLLVVGAVAVLVALVVGGVYVLWRLDMRLSNPRHHVNRKDGRPLPADAPRDASEREILSDPELSPSAKAELVHVKRETEAVTESAIKAYRKRFSRGDGER